MNKMFGLMVLEHDNPENPVNPVRMCFLSACVRQGFRNFRPFFACPVKLIEHYFTGAFS